MRIRAIDSSGDWVFGQGRQSYLEGEAAINEDVATALRIFRGECFFDLNAGVDWWALLGSSDVNGVVLAVRTVIAGRYGIRGIVSVDAVLDRVSRALRISYRVATIFSLQTNWNVSIPTST